MHSQHQRPLKGYRVIDLTTYVAAPSCSRFMADWGAEVIKVEPLSGDPFRTFGPTMSTPATDEENPLWDLLNANKRSLAVDLKVMEGRKVLGKLLEGADVFFDQLKAGGLEKARTGL